jgi:2-polyprenyl-6-methoxyphenol hydroxylase-like FAD-dependent oxidoreductase
MADIVLVGAGVVGLGTAMLLAADGHQVTVLERDPEPRPADPVDAWERWNRPGVNQFRLPHAFLARFRSVLDTELPQVFSALLAAGALHQRFIGDLIPDTATGGWRDGDERYALLTGRRPIVEAVVAAQAESTPGITVRRGTSVAGLVSDTPAMPGVPHVIGVRTKTGEFIGADLVVDMTGRRSALPDWLEAIGARRPAEELEDSGFVYYGRHFQSADGSVPVPVAPAVINWGTITSLTLSADNGTWAIGLVTGSKDKAMRPLRELDRWETVVRSLPLIAHWLDGTPLEERVQVMGRLEDRWRGFVVEGKPVATGVAAVADSWACSNPANGRGASIGMVHALTLRDVLRAVGLENPGAFADAFYAETAAAVEPWYRATLATDRFRLGEIDASIDGETYDPRDSQYELEKSLAAAAQQDPDCLRAVLDIALVLRRPDEVFAQPGLRDKALELGSHWRQEEPLGPNREELLALVAES